MYFLLSKLYKQHYEIEWTGTVRILIIFLQIVFIITFIVGVPEKKRMKWTLSLATTFLKSLMHHSGCSLEELRNNEIDKSVWIGVEEDMDHKYCYLRNFGTAGCMSKYSLNAL